MRFGAVFIALCMTIVAASLAAAAYLTLGLSAAEAAALAVAGLCLLVAYNAISGRSRDRAELTGRLTDLSRGTADLARQVGELGRRVVSTEAAVTQLAERTRSTTDPIASEIEVLGTLVKQLADSVATHEMMLLGRIAASASPPIAPDETPRAESPGSALPLPLPASRPAGEAGTTRAVSVADMLSEVRAALEGNRLDLYLQPIVTLPQRKVRYYEAMTRLRTEDGGQLLPADYLSTAESGGLMPMLDNLMLFRSVQVVRRLSSKNRDAGLFCNIAGSTLADSEFFPQFFEFLRANRALAPSLVFEFAQNTLRTMGPIENESLAQLTSLGFRFSLDQVTDLQFDPRQLLEQGFRFIKIPAALLLNKHVSTASDIHPTDLSSLLNRHGIELIAEKIETEGTVVDLLDYDIRFGQGFLFAPPRPVRSEVFASPLPRAASLEGAAQPDPVVPMPAATPAPETAQDTTSGLIKLARAFSRRN